jgi:hypothetical protein
VEKQLGLDAVNTLKKLCEAFPKRSNVLDMRMIPKSPASSLVCLIALSNQARDSVAV